jgi:hypothetical protein
MGVNQSKRSAEPYLWLLRQIRLPAFELAKAKLIEFSRKKSKMSVTKWELLLILQLNTDEVKKIGQFITGEQEPMTIDLNTIFILLVLCN